MGQLVAALAEKHSVTLLAPGAADEPAPPAGVTRVRYRASSSAAAAGASRLLLSGWPLQSLPFHQPELGRLLREIAPQHDVTVLQLVRLAPHLRDLAGVPLVADLIDCLSLNAATRAAVSPPWLRAALHFESRRLLAAERGLVNAARRSLLVCERDRGVLADALPRLLPQLSEIAETLTGLPTETRTEALERLRAALEMTK